MCNCGTCVAISKQAIFIFKHCKQVGGCVSYPAGVDLQIVPPERYSRTNIQGTHLLTSEG